MGILHIGVDVAKDALVPAVWLADGTGKPLEVVTNDAAGFVRLAEQLAELRERGGAEGIHLTIEPTAGYELRLAYFAHDQGWQISAVNPKQVRDWANGLGRRAKTDKLDALLLAQYGAQCAPVRWQPQPQTVSELDSLLTRRRELEKMLQEELNRQHSLSYRPGVAEVVTANVKTVIASLEGAIAVIEAAVDELLRRHPPMQQEVKRLSGIPGIGPKTVLPLLALLQRWDTITQGQGTGKALTAYVGFDPQTKESGKSIHGSTSISKMGNSQVRRMLFMAALGGIRGHNALRGFYLRLVNRGKAKMVALVAAARKILMWAWAIYHSASTFDPQRLPAAKSA
jgi:transposase